MKKRLLQIGSILIVLVVLFVSMGWDVKFHYCTENRHMTSSFVDTSAECLHCMGHHHEHEVAPTDLSHNVVHYDAKCCCDAFDSKIQFTDNFVFSTEKHLYVHFQPIDILHFSVLDLSPIVQQVFSRFSAREIPNLLIGRIGLIFFSQMKLNPLVF